MHHLVSSDQTVVGKVSHETDDYGREQAREHLTTATVMYREMDMPFWLKQAEAAIRALA